MRWSTWLSCSRGCLIGKNVLSEEVLEDKFFHIPPETSADSGLVPLTVVVRTVISRSEKCKVVLDLLRAPYSWLVFDSTEYFID